MLPFLAGASATPRACTRRPGRPRPRWRRPARLAARLGCEPGEVVFTGGGTEADNLAREGRGPAARARRGSRRRRRHAPSSTRPCSAAAERLAREGFRVARRSAVDRGGIVDLDALAAALDERTAVVSVMLVNNEVGTVQPLAEVAAIGARAGAERRAAHRRRAGGAVARRRAAAAADVDLVAISGHKFGGPKGVGVLVVRDGTRARAARSRAGARSAGCARARSNVAGVVALATALRDHRTSARRGRRRADRRAARPAAGRAARAPVPGRVASTATRRARSPGTCHVTFPGVEAEALLVALDRDGVYAAAGSACSSGAIEPSHVLARDGHGPGATRCRRSGFSLGLRVDRRRRRRRARRRPRGRRPAAAVRQAERCASSWR